jgi:integrase
MALRTLSKALAQAVEWGYIASKPRIHLFEEQGREATFTADYERRLLAVATQPLRDVFIILMDQGMRPEEVCRMRWEDVLWDRNTILVPKGKTKGSKRFIGMSPRVVDLLKERVRKNASATAVRKGSSCDGAGLLSGPVHKGCSSFVFPSSKAKEGHIVVDLLKERVRKQGEDGSRVANNRCSLRINCGGLANVKHSGFPWVFPSPKAKEGHIVTVNKAFTKARKSAGLPESLVLYSTRHTFGTDIMRATGNQKLVMVAMGHSDIKTSSRYQHPTTEGVGDIINERNNKRMEAEGRIM